MFTSFVSQWNSLYNRKCSLNSVHENLPGVMEGVQTNLKENVMSSCSSTITSDDFITPVSSMMDLMALSPQKPLNKTHITDASSDFLTGTAFDSICDVTMQEIPMYDEMFDATSLDYLVKCAESNKNHHLVDRGKESLFVKFDPLYAKQKLLNFTTSEGELNTDSSECDIGYETSSTTSAFTENMLDTPKQTVSNGSVLSRCVKDKPLQVVPPVVSNDYQKSSTTQTKSTPSLVRSASAILTPTQVITDRLISISGSTPPVAAPRSPRNKTFSSQEVDRLQSLRIILQNQDEEMLQLRQQNRELRSSLQETEHYFAKSKEEFAIKIKKLTDERDNAQSSISKLMQQVNAKTLSIKQMCVVVEEYEKTISTLIGDHQSEKLLTQEIIDKLTSEKEEALKHLTSMESSFNDLLAKYEKCKGVIIEAKEREKIFDRNISEYEAACQKYQDLYNNLKNHTSEKLDKANETLDNIKKSHNTEITKLNAIIKKHEIQISSLQETLVQKTRENEELTRICDQLINEVR